MRYNQEDYEKDASVISEGESTNAYDYYYNNYISDVPSPEKAITLAIVKEAACNLTDRNTKVAQDAKDWFFNPKSEEANYLYSFENICYLLGLNRKLFLDRLKNKLEG